MNSRSLVGIEILTASLHASGFAAFPGLVCCGVGEEGVSESAPAGSGVRQADDDGGWFGVGLFLSIEGRVVGTGVVVAAIGDAGLAEGCEGGGVAAGFGEEVAAEAEHVCPPSQRAVSGFAAHPPSGVAEVV